MMLKDTEKWPVLSALLTELIYQQDKSSAFCFLFIFVYLKLSLICSILVWGQTQKKRALPLSCVISEQHALCFRKPVQSLVRRKAFLEIS